MRILVVSRSYPSADDLYQYPFVHRRVLAYAEAGHDIAVFQPSIAEEGTSHTYEEIKCVRGGADLFRDCVSRFGPDVIAAHGFSELTHEILGETGYSVPTCAWLHGSEIPGFFRHKALCIPEPDRRGIELEAVEARAQFWRQFLKARPERFKLVFVSRSAVALAREDLGSLLGDRDFRVIHNPIDTGLFEYRPKEADLRHRVLLIRPFDSQTYGNDLAVAAILKLARSDGFERFEFTIIGDGVLFDETVAPLRRLPKVKIERRFLSQLEIAEYHKDNGIFLVPTRLDTQGVSRDEAMASGLVPVTNRVSAVPEFVDNDCAGLAAPDDPDGLAQSILEMADSPELFLARSRQAARRVRAQSGSEIIIPAELDLLTETAFA